MKTFVVSILAMVGVPLFAASAEQKKTPDRIYLSREAAEALIEIDYKGNPDKAVGLRKLRDYLGHREEISVAELQAIRNGPPDSPRPQPHAPHLQVGAPPADTFTLEQVRKRFQAKEKLNLADGKAKPTAADYEARLMAQVKPGSIWFTQAQIQSAEKYEFLKPTNPKQQQTIDEENAKFDALDKANDKVVAADQARHQGPRSLRIRRTWSDVLYDEDQSLSSPKKTIGDLEGALFSYIHDGKADTDTWNAHASLIWPIVFTHPESTLQHLAIAPSVTYDRVTTNGDPSIEANSLFFRLGFYLDLIGAVTHKPVITPEGQPPAAQPPALTYGLQLRAAGVYATDDNFHAGLPGFEADFEPRFLFGKIGLGYNLNLWRKKYPARIDGKDNSFLNAQLRVWLHTEGGDVQDAGQAWSLINGSFFRLGPTTQFTLAAPALPGDRTLSLTTLYSYLAKIEGPDNHPAYFRTTLALDLFRDPQLNHKVGIAASYERGGLNFTKQNVDAFTLGLNVLF